MSEIIDSNNQSINKADKRSVSRFLRFALARQLANINWVAGAVGGNVVVETYGFNPWSVAGGIALATTLIDYPQARSNAKQIEAINKNSKAIESIDFSPKELGGVLMSSWQGSGGTTEYNASANLKNTPKRNLLQATAFGIGVGLWSTPLPPFEQLSNYGEDAFEAIRNNPLESVVIGGVGSLVLFGAFQGFNAIKQSKQR